MMIALLVYIAMGFLTALYCTIDALVKKSLRVDSLFWPYFHIVLFWPKVIFYMIKYRE